MSRRLRAADETDGFEDRSAHPGVAADGLLDHPAGEVRCGAPVAGGGHAVGHRHEHVVVQVVADRQVGDHVDAVLAQVGGRADAGQHQQLGRAVDARAQDHLAAGRDRAAAVPGDDLDPGGAAAGDDDPGDAGAGGDGEVRQAVVVQVADGGAVAQAAAGVLLEDRHALLGLAVVVVDLLGARGRGQGLDEGLRGRGQVLLPRHLHRAAGAAQVGGAVFPVLHPLEAGQYVVVGPAGDVPVVVVLAVAADEQHAVDRAGAAEHPAAGLRDRAAERAGLRGGVVPPVQALLQGRDVVEDGDHAGLADQPGTVRAARLQQDDRGARLGQAPGQHAPGAARAGYDVVRPVLDVTAVHRAPPRRNSNTF